MNKFGELENMFSKNEMKPNTKKTFQTSYNRIVNSNLLEQSITETDNLKLIEIIKQVADKAESRNTLITLVVKLKRQSDKPILELEHFRVQNNTNRMKETQERKSDTKLDNVKLVHLLANEENLYNSKLYVRYIVNYLMNHYGVRNQDVNCLIIKDKKNIMPNENYLLVYKTKIEYIRDNYKTRDVYGKKIITIKDKKFINAVNGLEKAENEPLLLTQRGQERLSGESQGRVIQDLTYNQLGEGRVFKILIDEYKYDEKKLDELINSRGTNKQEIMKSYTIENLVD